MISTMSTATNDKIPIAYPSMVPSFSPSMYLRFIQSDTPSSSPIPHLPYRKCLIVYYGNSLHTYDLKFQIPGPIIIPYLEPYANCTDHNNLSPTVHV